MANFEVREDIVDLLDETGKWGKTKVSPTVALRAGFNCEYCDLDLLESLTHYRLIEIDHIIPKSKFSGDPDHLVNLALSCRVCNVNLKRAWDPRTATPADASRDELIEATRQYVATVRKQREQEFQKVRDIVGYS